MKTSCNKSKCSLPTFKAKTEHFKSLINQNDNIYMTRNNLRLFGKMLCDVGTLELVSYISSDFTLSPFSLDTTTYLFLKKKEIKLQGVCRILILQQPLIL